MDTTEIILKDGAFIRRTTSELMLGSQEMLLQNLADSRNLVLKGLLAFGDTTLDFLIGKRQLTIVCPISQLPFDTYFTPSTNPSFAHLVPHFSDNGTALKINDPWVMPKNLGPKLLFCLTFTSGGTLFSPQSAYLFVIKDGELFKLDYPNIYNDGRICMGPQWDTKKSLGKDLMSDFVHAFTTFNSTVCSSHLITPNTQAIFCRNFDGWIYPKTVEDLRLTPSAPAFMQGYF